MNKIYSILALSLALGLTGCAALGKYEHETEVNPNIYGDIEPSDTAANIAQFSWREVFTDPALQALIDEALTNNSDLKAAEEHIIQAQAQLTGAKLAYIPTLGLTPTFTTNFAGDNLSSKTYAYQINAASTWQLSFMRLANNVASAKASVQQMEDYRQAVRSSLIADVANAYYTILMIDAQYATSRMMKGTWAKSVETIKYMKEEGLADEVAVNQYVAQYETICITVASLEIQRRQAENAMNILLSKASGSAIERGNIKDQTIFPAIQVGIPVQMLALRPDIRAAERDMELAFYSTKGALLNYFPSLSLNGSFGLVNPSTGAISPMGLLAQVGAELTAPILNAGKNRAALETAESQQREARLAFDQALLKAGAEVNDALGTFKKCAEKEEYYAKSVESLRKASEDTEYLMYNSLDKTYLDVLYAYSNYFNSMLELISNKTQKMQAMIDLYSALGGGAID